MNTAQKLALIIDRLGYSEEQAKAFLAKQAERQRKLSSMSDKARKAFLAKEAEQQRQRAAQFRAEQAERAKRKADEEQEAWMRRNCPNLYPIEKKDSDNGK